jgi:hypothetical protein
MKTFKKFTQQRKAGGRETQHTESKHTSFSTVSAAITTTDSVFKTPLQSTMPQSNSGHDPTTKTGTMVAPLYRPLDRGRNEIRLLRIKPSTQNPRHRSKLEATTDIIVCELGYESLDAIKEDKQHREAGQSAAESISTAMMRMLHIYRDSETLQDHMNQQQGYKALTDEQKLKLGSHDDYHIDTARIKMLAKEYLRSMKIMAGWLPNEYRLMMRSAITFEHWLQNLI